MVLERKRGSGAQPQTRGPHAGTEGAKHSGLGAGDAVAEGARDAGMAGAEWDWQMQAVEAPAMMLAIDTPKRVSVDPNTRMALLSLTPTSTGSFLWGKKFYVQVIPAGNGNGGFGREGAETYRTWKELQDVLHIVATTIVDKSLSYWSVSETG